MYFEKLTKQMCLPVGFLKKIVSLEAKIILILAIVLFVGAVIVSSIEQKIVEAFNYLDNEENEAHLVSTSFWIFAILLFVVAICGLARSGNRNKYLLTFFNSGNICVFLAFLSLTIVAFIMDASIQAPECLQTGEISVLYKRGESQLCQKECPCYFKGDVKTVNKNIVAVTDYYTTDELPTKFQGCPSFLKNDNTKASALELVEGKLECSGWCQGYPIQIFNDVNAPVKNYNNSCYYAMYDYAKYIGETFAYVFLSLAIIFGLFVFFTCCLCFHPEQDITPIEVEQSTPFRLQD